MKLTIVTEGGRYEIENDSAENIAAVLAAVGPSLNIAPNASVALNGAAATPATPVADGDEISLTKPAGRKGGERVTVQFADKTITVLFTD